MLSLFTRILVKIIICKLKEGAVCTRHYGLVPLILILSWTKLSMTNIEFIEV